jgi:serine protease Do
MLLQNLVADGKVTRGYLGVVIGDIDNELLKVYKRKEGALVLDISADTPAFKYGLKRGDLIYAINGKAIKDRNTLQNTIASFKPDEKIILQVERDNKDIEISIILRR